MMINEIAIKVRDFFFVVGSDDADKIAVSLATLLTIFCLCLVGNALNYYFLNSGRKAENG